MADDSAGGRKILAVDDEAAVTLLISRVLERMGHTVRSAGSGEEAIELLSQWRPDLLIVDKNLPRMGGFELIHQARGLLPNLPVIVITAAPEPFAPRNERIDGYIGKPFKSLDALREAVNEAFERNRAAREREELHRKLNEVMAQLSAATGRSP